MALTDFGPVPANSVLPIMWSSHDAATGANETMSGLATSDILIYKAGSVTQRSSVSGFTLLDTDGIDFDGLAGVNGVSIDLSDNTDAGFYAVGSYYDVWVGAITIDGQTMYVHVATFRIVAAEAIAGKTKVDVDAWLGTAAATPTVAGVPEVDLTHVAGSTTNVAALATNVDAVLTDTGTTLQAELDAIEAAVITNAAGVDIAADIIAMKADTAAILVDTGTTLDTAIADLPTNAELATALGTADDAVIAAIATLQAFVDTEVAAILVDTNNLNDVALADSVPADGALPTMQQAIYEIRQFLMERSVAGTTVTTKKVDGSTTLETFTLNDGTTPTSITRAT